MIDRTHARLFGAMLTFGLLILIGGPAAEAAAPSAAYQAFGLETASWFPPQRISDSFADVDSDAPALAVIDGGEVHLVWEEGDELYHSYGSGSSWTGPVPVSGTGNGQQPALASGPDIVHLVYVKDGDIFHAVWDGSWSPSQQVSATTTPSDAPDLAVASDGSVHLVATERPVTGDPPLYYGESSDGATWPSYVPILGVYGDQASIDVTDTATETIQIAYRAYLLEGGHDIHTIRREEESWSAPQAITNAPEYYPTGPELVLDSDKPHVTWRETISATRRVQYAQGPTWTPAITISQGGAGITLPALGLGPQGGIHAAWGDGVSPPFRLLHTRSTDPANSASWQQPELVVIDDSLSFDEVILVGSENGTVHAAWVEGDTGEIWYARWPNYPVFLPLALRN